MCWPAIPAWKLFTTRTAPRSSLYARSLDAALLVCHHFRGSAERFSYSVMINQTNQLSEREREILRLVAGGLTNQQIANQLGISVNTVKVHLRNVFAKIGVASR